MRKNVHVLLIGVVAIFVAGLVLAGCGKGPDTAKPDAAKQAAVVQSAKVSVGILKLTSSAPIFIGMEKGFFKEQGIEIEPQWFDAAHPIAVCPEGYEPFLDKVFSSSGLHVCSSKKANGLILI